MPGNLLLLKSKRALYIDMHSDNEDKIAVILRVFFEKVIVAYSDKEAIEFYEDESPDLIILDIKNFDDIRVLKQLRQNDYAIPMIVITERNEKILLLDIANLSIDAFLYKPFELETLTDALCRSIKRNSNNDGLLVLNNRLIFNIATKELFLDGVIVALGAKEQQLLLLLIENRPGTVTKKEIEQKLWPLSSVCDSAVKKLVLRIRTKMKSNIIISVRGIGFRLDIAETANTQPWQKSA